VFSDAMSGVLDQLRQRYDMIIVDAPPLMPVIDGRVLGEYADHIILAASWDRTPQNFLAEAIEHLDYVRDRVIGTVLTQVDLRQAGLYDHYYNSIYFKPYDVTARPSVETAT
jgi:Mrp family chromosome partitioning ATPase